MSTDNRSIKIAFAMSVIDKVGEFLNTLTMQYELRYKWWINAVVMIWSVPHCLCWLFYFQNIITFLFEKLTCAVEILIWSGAVDFLKKLLGMPYSVVIAQQACGTEMVKGMGHLDHVWSYSVREIVSSIPDRGNIVGWVFHPTRWLVRFSHLNMPFLQNSEFI